MNKDKPSVQVIKLKPVHLEKIWGGTWLKEEFKFKTKSKNIGESWLISAHPGGDCRIVNSVYKGKTLSELYSLRRDLFADDPHEKFPLLVKLIDAREDLSVQVHPNDDYALHNENDVGKSEAWIILNAQPQTRIQIGHRARSREELEKLVKAGEWNKLLAYRKCSKGEIINIPSGTIHAICAGTALIEIQQSSDLTYRLFDYDRVDKDGRKRDLHLQKSLAVIDVPHRFAKRIFMPRRKDYEALAPILKTPYFRIGSMRVFDSLFFYNLQHKYYLIAVLEGRGKIGKLSAHKGDSFILTSDAVKTKFQGQLNLIISTL
ncbi:MAG TPA: mannose-6-phosphate isomerase [Bacilli bacterium]|jgi:mannose-6-phosphate isomerase|nr:mannose-6-phosphate isomerase [Erysipelotrichaceae bacterium]HOF53452.1 mannose-6-phosphate isomerase [Bacilli bacterium]